MYDFDLIQPGQTLSDARDAFTLGIEVTDKAAAMRCGLGVIDPQHGCGARSDAPAAIEACLAALLPPKGSRIVTIRPDLDSIGAMALLNLRAAGAELAEPVFQRIRRIAAIDRFDLGPWPGARPLPRSIEDFFSDVLGPDLSALASAVTDRSLTMTDKVVAVEQWLLTGEAPRGYTAAVTGRAEALLRSFLVGSTRLETASGGRIGVVISMQPGALHLAYRLAPVVVALNPAFVFPDQRVGRKYTAAAWADDHADLRRALECLAPLEPGWGGQARIKGSPQSGPSRLPLHKVIACVEQFLPGRLEGIAA